MPHQLYKPTRFARSHQGKQNRESQQKQKETNLHDSIPFPIFKTSNCSLQQIKFVLDDRFFTEDSLQ